MQSFLTNSARRLGRWIHDRRGNIAAITALLIVPLVACLSLATEGAGWFLTQRAAQAAADAAVLAAAANNDAATGGTTYQTEAKDVAGNVGFAIDTYTTVSPTYLTSACPSGNNPCYKVQIQRSLPLYLTEIVGYAGTTGNDRQLISAVAYSSAPVKTDDCMITLANSSDSFTVHGGPDFKAGGCNVFSNGGATCTGHDGGFSQSISVGTPNSTCGTVQKTGAQAQAETYYANLLTNNQPSGCVSIPAQTGNNLDLSGGCGTISGNLTVPSGTTTTVKTASSNGSVLWIKNGGSLILSGTMITQSAASGLTIIFSGNGNGVAAGFVCSTKSCGCPNSGCSGTVEFSAPTTGPWAGVSLYQDFSSTKPASWTYSGSNPAFNITGLTYMPYATLNLSGNIEYDTRGNACLIMVVYKMLINGSPSVFQNPTSQCVAAGVTQVPQVVTSRQSLVD